MGNDYRRITPEELIEGLEDALESNEEDIDKLNLSPVEHALALEDNRKSTVKDYVRSLREEAKPYTDAADEIENKYTEYTVTRRDFPPKWMKHKKTAKVFKETEFNAFMKYIKKTDTLELTRSLQKYLKVYTREEITDQGRKVNREIRLYAMNYADAEKKLELTRDVIQKYMTEAVRIGLFKIMCNGCGGRSPRPTIYDIGSWNLEISGRNIQIWHFEKDKEWVEKIASFSPFKR